MAQLNVANKLKIQIRNALRNFEHKKKRERERNQKYNKVDLKYPVSIFGVGVYIRRSSAQS